MFRNVIKLGRFREDRKVEEGVYPVPMPEAPVRTEFLLLLRISEFFGFQWQNLAEILHLFKKYRNIGKVAVKRVSLTDYAL